MVYQALDKIFLVFIFFFRWINSAKRVFEKAKENDIMGDEENAYVFYMRFFNIMQEVMKTTKYQNDKVASYYILFMATPLLSIPKQ